jgi:hypothetical protein
MKVQRIQDIIPGVIKTMSSGQGESKKDIGDVWYDIVGEDGKKHTRVSGVKDGILKIDVDSPAWLYQMNMKRKNIMDQLIKEKMEIKKIIFKIGNV